MTEQEHIALVSRTLAIDEHCWRQFVYGFLELTTGSTGHTGNAFGKECSHKFDADLLPENPRVPRGSNSSLDDRVATLTRLWASLSPHARPLPESCTEQRCLVCETGTVKAVTARRIAGQAPLVYGACDDCKLGVLLSGGAADSIYTQPNYYQQRDSGNAGYESYLAEKDYREAKGRRLMERIASRANRPLKTLLEVGSGFGFTRAGAEQLGMKTAGVDLNPFAAETALAIYDQTTFTGTLADAVTTNAIPSGCWDVALYLFVLEHLQNPLAELKVAAQTLSPNGVLALIVPNMQSLEREIFGASYRSFRHDHLWLFSVRSLQLLLEPAGLKIISIESECNIRLLRGFLTETELNQLDTDCRSADLIVIAERKHQ